MRAFYAVAALWATLALYGPSASFAGPGVGPEKTVPQGQDPPGAENGQQPPPPIGDEEIHTEAPNPEAGHEEEVIRPPAPGEAPSVTPH